MSNGDKRKVSTDALETLGTIIGPEEKRDAIHLAVIPMQAKEPLSTGVHVSSDGHYCTPYDSNAVGIVDPFLHCVVNPGDWFWLVIYPRQISSLRHVWTHPAFPEEEAVKAKEYSLDSHPDAEDRRKMVWWDSSSKLASDEIEKSKKWIEEYAKTIIDGDDGDYDEEGYGNRLSYKELMDGAKEYLETGFHLNLGTNDDYFEYETSEFWHHYEIVTGEKVSEDKKKLFFTCSC